MPVSLDTDGLASRLQAPEVSPLRAVDQGAPAPGAGRSVASRADLAAQGIPSSCCQTSRDRKRSDPERRRTRKEARHRQAQRIQYARGLPVPGALRPAAGRAGCTGRDVRRIESLDWRRSWATVAGVAALRHSWRTSSLRFAMDQAPVLGQSTDHGHDDAPFGDERNRYLPPRDRRGQVVPARNATNSCGSPNSSVRMPVRVSAWMHFPADCQVSGKAFTSRSPPGGEWSILGGHGYDFSVGGVSRA